MQFEINNLFFAYYRSPLTIGGAKFSLEKNQKALILAKSGAGKTTLLSVLSGFNDTYLGSIKFDGTELKDLEDEKKNFSLLLSDPVFFEKKSIRENFKLLEKTLGRKFDEEEIYLALEKFGLEISLDVKIKKLSLLDKRKLAFARSFLKKPSVIFVDDLFEGLNESEVEEAKKLAGAILSNFDFCTLVWAASDDTFKKHKEIFENTNFSKVLYLNLSKLFVFDGLKNFYTSFADRDFFDFVSGYQKVTAQLNHLNKKFFLLIDERREVELSNEFSSKLSALKLQEIGSEDCVIYYSDSFDFENLTDGEIIKKIKSQEVKIYSNLDAKRIL